MGQVPVEGQKLKESQIFDDSEDSDKISFQKQKTEQNRLRNDRVGPEN